MASLAVFVLYCTHYVGLLVDIIYSAVDGWAFVDQYASWQSTLFCFALGIGSSGPVLVPCTRTHFVTRRTFEGMRVNQNQYQSTNSRVVSKLVQALKPSAPAPPCASELLII